MKKILFLDEDNLWHHRDPIATLIEIPEDYSIEDLKLLEEKQSARGWMGGSWKQIMEDGNIVYSVVSRGHQSNYTKKDYDEIYRLTVGMY